MIFKGLYTGYTVFFGRIFDADDWSFLAQILTSSYDT